MATSPYVGMRLQHIQCNALVLTQSGVVPNRLRPNTSALADPL